MKDKVYCGHLVSDDKLEHSSGPWKKHAYVKKTQEDGYVRYWYPNGEDKGRKPNIQNGATDEELDAADREYEAAMKEWVEAGKPHGGGVWHRLEDAAEEKSRADSIRRNKGEKQEVGLKEAAKKNAKDVAKEKGKNLLNKLDPRGRANDSVGTRTMPNNSEADDRKKKRKSLSLFNHGVRHTGSKKKESKSDEVLKLEPTGNVPNGTPTRQNRTSQQNQYYNGAFLSTGANRESYTSIGNKKPVSRPKNIIGRRASKDAMDDFLQDHPNVHKNTNEKDKRDARLSTSIDASPVKDKKLRKQKVGRR